LMAAGISRVRVVLPVIIAVGVISLLAAINRDLVIPKFRSHLAIRPKDMVGDKGKEVPPRYDGWTRVLIGGAATFADQRRIESPDFQLPASLDLYGKHLKADSAFYRSPTDGQPGGYLFQNVQEPKNLHALPSLSLGGRSVLITPRDATWLKPDECFLVSDLSFEQFTAASSWREFSSVAELIRGLHNPSLTFEADVRVTVHARFLQPLMDMTLLFLGLPLVLTRESRNLFLAIGLCAVVTSIFVLVVMAFQYLGSISFAGISPALAAWAPLMIFAPIAVALADFMWE